VSLEGSLRLGALSAIAAFLLWGVFPLYWKLLAAVPALEVVAHRTIWGFFSVALWVTWRRRWSLARAAAARSRTLLALVAAALLIGFNWLLFIWAVAHAHVAEASLGYYINPLLSVVLGVAVLGERLGRAQLMALALAGTGVTVLTLAYGRLPWIALALALSFALYGLVRKTVAADAVTGLLWETGILVPAALAWLVRLAVRGEGSFAHMPILTSGLLALAGPVTAIPLVLFAKGARALPLSTIGLFQYLAPSLQFLLAVAVFREPFTTAHLVTFACIWSALALLSVDLRRRLRR
jgi:chloramphenicol-sensitive protein RarD